MYSAGSFYAHRPPAQRGSTQLPPHAGSRPLSRQDFHSRSYHLLIDSDEVEYGRLEQLLSQDFQFVAIEMLKDLNLLLYLNEDEFWTHLQAQDHQADLHSSLDQPLRINLRLCLQSCLTTFTRKPYLHYNTQLDPDYLSRLKQLPHFWLNAWAELKKVVLFLFYRICVSEKAAHRAIRFRGWYIDTCKLLDLCLIYGKENPEILKKMCSAAYSGEEQVEDCREAVGLALEQLQKVCLDLHFFKVDLQELPQEANPAELSCEQPFEVIAESLSILLFKVLDLGLNLESMLRYFPAKCQRLLLEEALLFKRLIMAYCKLRENMDCHWKLGQHRPKYATFAQLIYQQLTLVLAKALAALHSLLFELTAAQERQQEVRPLKTTFINVCHFLFVAPAVNYFDREDQHKRLLYKHYQLALAQSMVEAHPAKPLFSNSTSIALFNRAHPNFLNLAEAARFESHFRRTTCARLVQLKRYEHWRLPAQPLPEPLPQPLLQHTSQPLPNQYQDDFQDPDHHSFPLEACLSHDSGDEEPHFYLEANHLPKFPPRRKPRLQNSERLPHHLPRAQKATKYPQPPKQSQPLKHPQPLKYPQYPKQPHQPQQPNQANPGKQKEAAWKEEAGEKVDNSFGSLSLSLIEHRQKSREVVSFDLNELGNSLAGSLQVSDNTGLTQTEWSHSENSSRSINT